MKEFPNKRNKYSKTSRDYIKYTGVGLQIVAAVFGMAMLGNWIDKRFENDIPVFTLSLSLLAVFGILYKLIKASAEK